MKKIIVLTMVALSTLGLSAQHSKTAPPPPPPPMEAPTPPMPPSVEEVKFTPPVIAENDLPVPPTPPKPPMAPAPPKKPIGQRGYNLSVRSVNGVANVLVKGKGINKTISLKEWLANEKVYEAKYGKLPPPPPPPPPPPSMMN